MTNWTAGENKNKEDKRPSTRIFKIYAERMEKGDEDSAHAALFTICQYLDEEYEAHQKGYEILKEWSIKSLEK